MAEFDPERFVRCDRDLLCGPAGPVPQGGYMLDANEWLNRRHGLGRRFQNMRDVIIYGRGGGPEESRHCMGSVGPVRWRIR